MPAGGLARRWGVPQCGVFRTLTSSLDAIHDLAAQGAPAGTVVLAEGQTAGRGPRRPAPRGAPRRAGGPQVVLAAPPPPPPGGVVVSPWGPVLRPGPAAPPRRGR